MRHPSHGFSFDVLTRYISNAHIVLQSETVSSINRMLTIRNWLIGRYIVEYEQHGEDRARYGANLLCSIAKSIDIKGINTTLLKNARRFYLLYPQMSEVVDSISPMVSDKFAGLPIHATMSSQIPVISPMVSDKFMTAPKLLLSRLSFSHIVELLAVEDRLVRFFYEFECMRNVWSVKELRRQISANLHVRVGLSKSPEQIMMKLAEITERQNTSMQLREPLALEFLGLDPGSYITENDLEDSLIRHLQGFILELGKGFCFEARQKRMIIDDRYYFADLVFYNRLLHCNVIMELKNDEFRHEYLGQLNAYVSYYRENEMQPGDNPPVGILLCTRRGKRMVEYALAGMDNTLFVSTYQICLPDKKQLECFLESAMDS